MLGYIRAEAPKLVVSTLMRAVNIFSGVFLFAFSGYTIASAVVAGVYPTGQAWAAIVVLGLVKAVARYLEQVVGHDAAFHILDDLRRSLFWAYTEQEPETLASERSGDLVARAMSDVELIEIFFAHTLAPSVVAIAFVVSAGTATTVLVGPAAGAAVLGAYLLAGIAVPLAFQRLLAPRAARLRAQQAALGADIAESLAGITDLTAFAALDRERAAHRDAARTAHRDNRRLQVLNGVRDVLIDVLLVGSLLAVVFFGATAGGIVSDPILWAVVCGLAGGSAAILGVNRAVDDLPKSRAAAARILAVLRPEDQPAPTDAPAGRGEFDGYAITVDHLTCRYANGRGIEDVTLEIAEGTHLLVTGPSGSGKTTLATAMLGLLPATSGRVILGGTDVRAIDPTERFLWLSAARQNLTLVRGTAEENVELGVRSEGDSVPAHALAIPEILELFTELPDGAQTLIGGAEEQVSGGQRRRIGLSAALARTPRVLVLDEAFAGLDDSIRRGVRERLLAWAAAHRVTVIELTHDIGDARDADQIAVMAAGRLVEHGTFADLIARRGVFADLALVGA